MKPFERYLGMKIEYCYQPGKQSNEVFICWYPNNREFNFFDAANFQYLPDYAVAGFKIKLKKQQTNFTPYNPEDLTPLPEGYVDELP